MPVLLDPDLPLTDLRRALYGGDLVLLTRLPAVSELVARLRRELGALFAPHDPEHAHEHFDKEQTSRILASWKPAFIHSEEAAGLVRAIIRQAGFPAGHTHYDLPRPRTSFPVGHLTTGIAYAFPWHRDLWYSAPAQQINWWLPVFPLRPDNAMGFDLASFGRPVPNTSSGFDYYRNNVARRTTAAQLSHERQARPGARRAGSRRELVLLPAPGQVLLFSGAQLHRSTPNTSGVARFSVDFRTVDARDLRDGRGAPVVDVACTGTAVRDFRNVADGTGFDEALVRRLFGAPPPGAVLVYEPA